MYSASAPVHRLFMPRYPLFAWNITFIVMLTVYRWNIQQHGASQNVLHEEPSQLHALRNMHEENGMAKMVINQVRWVQKMQERHR